MQTKKILRIAYPQLTPLWIAVFIDILGFSILIPFLPFFSQEFNLLRPIASPVAGCLTGPSVLNSPIVHTTR